MGWMHKIMSSGTVHYLFVSSIFAIEHTVHTLWPKLHLLNGVRTRRPRKRTRVIPLNWNMSFHPMKQPIKII